MENLKDITSQLPNRETAPFVADVGSRVLKGAAIGYLMGLVFFKRSRTRRFMMYYGAGFGLGMSYTQMRNLYLTLTRTAQNKYFFLINDVVICIVMTSLEVKLMIYKENLNSDRN